MEEPKKGLDLEVLFYGVRHRHLPGALVEGDS